MATVTELLLSASVDIADYSDRFSESTTKTLVGHYARRDQKKRKPIESLNEIIWRVATAVAIAEIRYKLKPEEIVALDIEQALKVPGVTEWAWKFAFRIGNKYFWANTPANINADPEVALKVLQYEAYGKLAGLTDEQIWLWSGNTDIEEKTIPYLDADRAIYILDMQELRKQLHGKGCLAACGVTPIEDSLDGIQECARKEALAAKASMGMGVNTSTLRPWNSSAANGAAASGPDRFYAKTIASAVEAVAQGGRRGGALIELRDSDHPDILFFIDKKKLAKEPKFAEIYFEMLDTVKCLSIVTTREHKRDAFRAAEIEFGKRYAEYERSQRYLKNTNISVCIKPGFMDAVANKKWYPAKFLGVPWRGELFDPRFPIMDSNGNQMLDEQTKEPLFREYQVDAGKYPEAFQAAGVQYRLLLATDGYYQENPGTSPSLDGQGTVKFPGHFYAPEVFDRIVEGNANGGEPGVFFWEHVNAVNANNHQYDLNTSNPCAEECLPAGTSKDSKRVFMGVCNLSSAHAAHSNYWDGSKYNYELLARTINEQVRFMDNVVDITWFPIPEQNYTVRQERRLGGGFAGLAEFLARQGLEFGSAEALAETEKLYRKRVEASVLASVNLAEERGTYPLWEGSRWEEKGVKVRNTCLVNQAPTGTLAQAMETSWGVDPFYGLVFSRQVRTRKVRFMAPGFEDAMRKAGAWPATEQEQIDLLELIYKNNKSCRGLAQVPESVQRAFPIREEISPRDYVLHLAACYAGGYASYPEAMNSISNTCAIPKGSPETVGEAIMLAYENKIKAISFYPDGSRLSQPNEKVMAEHKEFDFDLLFSELGVTDRRMIDLKEMPGSTYKVNVGNEHGVSTLHVTLNHERGQPANELVEVYCRLGKSGSMDAGLLEALGRVVSAFLQFAAELSPADRARAEAIIVKQLENIDTGYTAFYTFNGNTKQDTIKSPCDALAKTIKYYQQKHRPIEPLQPLDGSAIQISEIVRKANITVVEALKIPTAYLGLKCPQCGGSRLMKIEGCSNCEECGYSKC